MSATAQARPNIDLAAIRVGADVVLRAGGVYRAGRLHEVHVEALVLTNGWVIRRDAITWLQPYPPDWPPIGGVRPEVASV